MPHWKVVTMMEKQIGSRLIPDPVHAEVKVHVELPPEATALLRDLHSDRQTIGAGSLIMLACTVALTMRQIFGKKE